MIKYKAKTKDCQLKVRVKLSFDIEVDFNELSLFSRKLLRGFLKPQKLKPRIIEYTGPVGISLYERLKKPITKYDFFFIIIQVVEAIKKLQKNNLSLKNVVWNTNHAYINEATKEVQFIYLPTSEPPSSNEVVAFFESIVYFCKPIVEKDTDYASRFLYFIRNLRSINISEIEKYVAREESKVVKTINRHSENHSGYMTDKQQDYLEHYQGNMDNNSTEEDEATGLLEENQSFNFNMNNDEDEATGLLDSYQRMNKDEEDEATGLLEDEEATGLLQKDSGYDDNETMLLEENDENATLLLTEEPVNIHYPKLVRIINNETIEINKPVFRIGKERSFVDYFVQNNNAVSRSHADIITRGQHYFVIDLNSKNRTFINGNPIPVQTECEITNGNQLRLANEEFVFYV